MCRKIAPFLVQVELIRLSVFTYFKNFTLALLISSNTLMFWLFFLSPHLTRASILSCSEWLCKVNYEDQICLPYYANFHNNQIMWTNFPFVKVCRWGERKKSRYLQCFVFLLRYASSSWFQLMQCVWRISRWLVWSIHSRCSFVIVALHNGFSSVFNFDQNDVNFHLFWSCF